MNANVLLGLLLGLLLSGLVWHEQRLQALEGAMQVIVSSAASK